MSWNPYMVFLGQAWILSPDMGAWLCSLAHLACILSLFIRAWGLWRENVWRWPLGQPCGLTCPTQNVWQLRGSTQKGWQPWAMTR